MGRFVRVEIPGNQRTLTLAEVEVLADGRNVARQGRATQKNTSHGGEAKRREQTKPIGCRLYKRSQWEEEFQVGSCRCQVRGVKPRPEQGLRESRSVTALRTNEANSGGDARGCTNKPNCPPESLPEPWPETIVPNKANCLECPKMGASRKTGNGTRRGPRCQTNPIAEGYPSIPLFHRSSIPGPTPIMPNEPNWGSRAWKPGTCRAKRSQLGERGRSPYQGPSHQTKPVSRQHAWERGPGSGFGRTTPACARVTVIPAKAGIGAALNRRVRRNRRSRSCSGREWPCKHLPVHRQSLLARHRHAWYSASRSYSRKV